MTTTPNAPTWPQHPAHKPQLNPAASSLTHSQAREFAVESGTCSDGTQCGTFAETAYCDDCPNQPKDPTRQQMIDRCNATLPFWPTDAEAANQVMPVELPWRWAQDDVDIVLINLRSKHRVTNDDWCAGEDLSSPQCLHYGGECGEIGYCAPCPNRPQPDYDPDDVAFKQPRIDTGAHYRYQYKARITPADIERGYVVVNLDPYRIAGIYALGGGPREHATKKLLCGTSKGEDQHQVIQQVRDALDRWEEMLDEDADR